MSAIRKMTDELEPVHVAVRMAEAIMDCLEKNGHCRILDVEALGFSRNDVARYWPDAMKIVEEQRPRPGRRLN